MFIIFCCNFGTPLKGDMEFNVLVAVKATTDSRNALTPQNVHRTFRGAFQSLLQEVTVHICANNKCFHRNNQKK